MKKMFLRGCLFSLLLVIPFGYLNYRYKNTNYYKQLNGLGKFCTVPEDIQILNLGNLHERMGIVYDKNEIGLNNVANIDTEVTHHGTVPSPLKYSFPFISFFAK